MRAEVIHQFQTSDEGGDGNNPAQDRPDAGKRPWHRKKQPQEMAEMRADEDRKQRNNEEGTDSKVQKKASRPHPPRGAPARYIRDNLDRYNQRENPAGRRPQIT